MSDGTLRNVITAVITVHGLGHGGALAALALIAWHPGSNTGGWKAARSWLLPSLSSTTATVVASTFWTVAFVGFLGAVLLFLGVLLPGDIWHPLAIGSAIVSAVGIVLFFGNWPFFNTLAALGVNTAVLVALVGWAGSRRRPSVAGRVQSGGRRTADSGRTHNLRRGGPQNAQRTLYSTVTDALMVCWYVGGQTGWGRVVFPLAGAGTATTQVGVPAPLATSGMTPYPGDTDALTESTPLIVSPVSEAMTSACALASASAAVRALC